MELVDLLADKGKLRPYPKGRFVFRQGEKADKLFLIRQGLVKAYYETHDGKEFIKSFIPEGGLIASLHVIVADQPSTFNVLALEDSTILEVTKADLDSLQAQHPPLTQALYSFLLGLAMKKEKREYEFLCLSADERYQRFCDAEPGLVARLSQMDIARYLGITPVALSRIRRRRLQAPA